MSRLFDARISPEVGLRALAISLVTFNHSQELATRFGFGGGMSFLMLLSGYNFAKFAMDGRTPPEVRASAVKLGLGVGVPTLALVLFSFLVKWDFDWWELLFAGNIHRKGVASMYLWYPHMLVQLLLGLWLLFSIRPLATVVLRRPWISSLVIFAGAVLIRGLFPMEAIHHHVPHLFLWNFALGWLTYFSLTRPVIGGWWRPRLFVMVCTAVGVFVGWGWNITNPYLVLAAMAVFLFSPPIPAPGTVARLVNLVSQATFTIFLLHALFIGIYDRFLPQDSIAKFAFSMTLSILCWVAGAACVRAYNQRRRIPSHA